MVVDEKQEKRLRDFGINIKTKYRDGDLTLERNSDHSKEDNIQSGILLEKDYCKDGIVLKKEKDFDSRMIYSYVFEGNQSFTCNNCGMTASMDKFKNGCPYCHTCYNMEYHQKELGSKHYYDLTIKNKKYIVVVFFIALIVSFLVVATFIVDTSRTLYFFDLLKIVVGTILITLISFFCFYYLDALFLLPFVRKMKENENQKQKDFWESMNYSEQDKTKFFNNVLYSLRQYYYSDKEKNVIDFDIIDYNSFRKENINKQLFVEVCVLLRIVEYRDGKVFSKKCNKTYRFKKVKQSSELEGGTNLIQCPNCDSSIHVTDEKCSYCGTKIGYYQEWYFDKVVD